MGDGLMERVREQTRRMNRVDSRSLTGAAKVISSRCPSGVLSAYSCHSACDPLRRWCSFASSDRSGSSAAACAKRSASSGVIQIEHVKMRMLQPNRSASKLREECLRSAAHRLHPPKAVCALTPHAPHSKTCRKTQACSSTRQRLECGGWRGTGLTPLWIDGPRRGQRRGDGSRAQNGILLTSGSRNSHYPILLFHDLTEQPAQFHFFLAPNASAGLSSPYGEKGNSDQFISLSAPKASIRRINL